MIEVILLQIPALVREALQVRTVYHCNCLVYVKHVLLHRLVIPLLDLIQSPYHGIIIALVAKCPLHVHRQVPHRDVLTLVQHVVSFAWVPMETGEDVGVHTSLIVLLEKGIYIEAPERVCHLPPQIVQLKDWHIQSRGHQPFPLPTPSAASAPMPVVCNLTCSEVSVRVWHSPVWGRRGRPPSADCSALGLWWPSTQSCNPCMGGEPCLSPLSHTGGSSVLQRYTPHQLGKGV